MAKLTKRNIFITGAASGVGRATAMRLAAQDDTVFLVDLDEAGLKATQDQITATDGRAFICAVDLSDVTQIQAAFESFDQQVGGPLHVLLPCAGIGAKRLRDTSIEQIARVVAVNLTAPMVCCKLAAERMDAGGQILLFGSLCNQLGDDDAAVYAAPKLGVESLAWSFRKEAHEKGIKVGILNPGRISAGSKMDGENPGITADSQIQSAIQHDALSADEVAWYVVTTLSAPLGTLITKINLRAVGQNHL